jgi:hypothetical protein
VLKDVVLTRLCKVVMLTSKGLLSLSFSFSILFLFS